MREVTGPDAPEPMTQLDWVIPVLRIAEAIEVAAAFTRAMGASVEGTTLHHAFRWDRLAGRELSAWAQSGIEAARYGVVEPGRRSRQKEVLTLESVLDTPASLLGRYVRQALTRKSFSAGPGAHS